MLRVKKFIFKKQWLQKTVADIYNSKFVIKFLFDLIACVYIYIFLSLSLVFYSFISSLSFSSRMSKHSKKEKEKKFRRLLHSLVRFFHTFFHSFSQLCHYIVCSDALRSVCVSQRECVRFISYIFYIFFLYLSFFTRNRMREKRTRSISFLRVESLLLLVTASKGIRYQAPREITRLFFFLVEL